MSTKPDFAQMHSAITKAESLAQSLQEIADDNQQRAERIRSLSIAIQRKQATVRLDNLSIRELEDTKPAIRIQTLEDAGYNTIGDVYRATDDELMALPGIGEKSSSAIRNITDTFLDQIAAREPIHLSAEPSDQTLAELETELVRCKYCGEVCIDAAPILEATGSVAKEIVPKIRIRSAFGWFFSGKKKKEETAEALAILTEYCDGIQVQRAERLLGLYEDYRSISTDECMADLRKNAATYYALLERILGQTGGQKTYHSIPEKVAAEIEEETLATDRFKGDLRAYQEFGAKYILHQKRVLLGDEMGLGKTIQAIAVMAHLESLLNRENRGGRFLVVCPASVLTNWCREIRKFSEVKAYLLHGKTFDSSLTAWKESGGAAVTNYESMEKLVDHVNNKMHLELFVIDEAHYIKNPEAKRTKYVHMLEDESERILLMTGTPLENNVDEMCELIGFIRPELIPKIRKYVGRRDAPGFHEMLAPAYLRRHRSDVLKELPPLTEEVEWCTMTPSDQAAYAEQVRKENFTGMRRVSFLQETGLPSAKLQRLKELCEEAVSENRKVIVFSYFRETLQKVQDAQGFSIAGEITGDTKPEARQGIINHFQNLDGGGVLLCQIIAGGTGLNIQAASVVIFCEPQIKPSLTKQAISRVYRMGQIQDVLVYHLVMENTVDEAVLRILANKEEEFSLFAEESALADAADMIIGKEWIQEVLEEERQKYLPAVIS